MSGAVTTDGVREVADTILEKQARVGRPLAMDGMAEAAAGPTFTVCMGLLRYGLGHHAEEADPRIPEAAQSQGSFSRISQWLRENF